MQGVSRLFGGGRRALLCGLIALSSAYCHRYVGGIGTVAPAGADGSTCNNDVECASNTCTNGACAPPPAGMIEIDGDCSGGGSCVAIASCQDGICVANSTACAANNSPCETDSDCCGQICTNGACGFGDTNTGGSTTTGPTCASEGEPCNDSSDCCSGGCDMSSSDFVCSSSCGQSGDSCFSDSDCCSGVCASGTSTCI